MDHGPAGRRLGPYALGPKAGAGGMGVVYRAEHVETGARHAVKCLLPGASGDDVLRFRREAEAMARVDGHPHVLRVHSVGVEPGGPWLAMEWAAGGSLADRLVRGPLPIDEVVALGRALASGLAHVHRHGVLHRDLKPANVLFDEAGAPKLTDFGLARVVGAGSLTQSGTVLGTPAYMAPEQAQASKALDARTDVYGLGALLYHALTGRPPFEGTSIMAVLSAVLEREPAAPRSLRGDVPPWLQAVVLRMLARRPEERFADMASVEAALAAGRAPAPRRGRLALLGAALVAGAALGVALVASRGGSPRSAVVVVDAPAAAASAAVVDPGPRDPRREGWLRGLALLEAGDPAAGDVLRKNGPMFAERVVALDAIRGRVLELARLTAVRPFSDETKLVVIEASVALVADIRALADALLQPALVEAIGPAEERLVLATLRALATLDEAILVCGTELEADGRLAASDLQRLATAARPRDERAGLALEVLAAAIAVKRRVGTSEKLDLPLARIAELGLARTHCIALAVQYRTARDRTWEQLAPFTAVPALPGQQGPAVTRLIVNCCRDVADDLIDLAWRARTSAPARTREALELAVRVCDSVPIHDDAVMVRNRALATLMLGRSPSEDDLVKMSPARRLLLQAELALLGKDYAGARALFEVGLRDPVQRGQRPLDDLWTGRVVAAALAGEREEVRRLLAELEAKPLDGESFLPWRAKELLGHTLRAIEGGWVPRLEQPWPPE